jgi:chloride channel protein, CIC family
MSGDRLKTLVACGVAGGVAATFNAPIAGVFFAQEIVLLSSFELSSFTSIVIASGMSTVVSRALLGEHPACWPSLRTPQPGNCSSTALGLVVGLLAGSFIDLHFRIKDRFAALPLHPLAKPAVGGAWSG